MKIERKRKSTRRGKNLRNSSLQKRTKIKANIKYNSNNDTLDISEISNNNNTTIENALEGLPKNGFLDNAIFNLKSNKSFITKLAIISTFCIAIIVISLNITPILKYALQDQDSAIYPMLKKYSDELRRISNQLTVVTRRLNMLSLISEENELNNVNRINSLVLQINEMWFITKKYLNFIGIETIAHTELEKEIDANSKINDKGLIRKTKTEEIIPENEITLSKILKLDAIIQKLNSEIESVNNEITFLEDNVYASIKASHIYSRLLERSRNANGNYYANSTTQINNYKPDNRQVIATTKQILISNNVAINSKKTPITPLLPVTIINKPKKQITKPIKIIVSKPKQVKQKKIQKIITVKVKTPIKKIVGAFKIKAKPTNLNKKSPLKKDKISNTNKKIKIVNAPFESPTLLDDVIMDFVTNYNDYGDTDDEKSVDPKNAIEEEDDYTGG